MILSAPKRYKSVYLVGLCFVLALTFLVVHPQKASAACAAQDTSRGQVTSTFSVPSTGSYRVWSRILAPDTTNNSYVLEIDGTTCGVVVGGSTTFPANTWTWVDYQGGTASSKINVTLSAGAHTMTLIGREDNVELDRVIFTTDTTCVPTGTGDNCANPPDTTNPTVSITAPTAGSTVKNTVTVQSTAADDVALAKVEFYIDGTLVASDTTTPYNYTFDTTTVSNGSHTILAKAYDTSQNTASATVAVNVNNPAVCTPGSSTLPTTPGNVTSSSTYTQITLNWSPSTGSPGCTITNYKVFRGGALIATLGNVTTYTDSGLIAGNSYNYNIQAVDSGPNNSAQSALSSFSTTTDNLAANPVTGVTATANGAARVDLSWAAATDLPNPGGVGIAGYNIYRNGASTPTYQVTGANTTSYADTNVSASTKYTYTITSVDKASNESAPSASVSATTAAPTCSGTPSVPTGLVATGRTISTITFGWTASTASAGCTLSGYHVYRGGTFVADVTSGLSFTDTGLNPNTGYSYTVKAFDTSAHTSAASTTLSASTSADTSAPSAPGSVAAVAISSSNVNLTWTASTDNIAVTGYNIYRGGVVISTVGGSILTYSDTSLVGNTDYVYQVSAIDGAINESAKVTATPNPVHTPTSIDKTPPSTPTNPQTPVIASQSAKVTWTPATDNVGVVGYHVYIKGILDTFDGDTTTASFTARCLAPNIPYAITVKAFDAAGNISSTAMNVSLTTLGGGFAGDFDCSTHVDFTDLTTLARNWVLTAPARFLPTDGDASGDAIIDFTDLTSLARNWGK